MKPELTLSEYVRDYITNLDVEGSPEDVAEGEQTRKLFEIIVGDIVSARETITDRNVGFSLPGINANLPLRLLSEKILKLAPGLIKYFLDRQFTCEVIKAVPGYVERTLQLSRLEGLKLPSKTTNGYLQEAVRTYILGLPQASVALSRAAMEQALKERLGRQLSGDFITFQKLLQEACKWNVLDRTMELYARDIANAGDCVMHEKLTTLQQALNVLDKLRGVLQHVYSQHGHY